MEQWVGMGLLSISQIRTQYKENNEIYWEVVLTTLEENYENHCVKYQNFNQFPGTEAVLKKLGVY